MKKTSIICCAVLLGAASFLGGCAEFSSVLSSFDSAINSPANQQAVATLETAATVLICDVSRVAQLSQQIEQAVSADQSIIGTTGKVLVASSIACTALGGVTGSSITAPAGAAVVQ